MKDRERTDKERSENKDKRKIYLRKEKKEREMEEIQKTERREEKEK